MWLLLCALPKRGLRFFSRWGLNCLSQSIKNEILNYLFNLRVLSSEIISTQDFYTKNDMISVCGSAPHPSFNKITRNKLLFLHSLKLDKEKNTHFTIWHFLKPFMSCTLLKKKWLPSSNNPKY